MPTDEFDNRESLAILFGVSQSAKTRDLAYDFVKQNWDALVAKLPMDTGSFLPFVAGGYCDTGHREDVKAFFKGRSTNSTGGTRILTQVLEGIDLCVAYKKAQGVERDRVSPARSKGILASSGLLGLRARTGPKG